MMEKPAGSGIWQHKLVHLLIVVVAIGVLLASFQFIFPGLNSFIALIAGSVITAGIIVFDLVISRQGWTGHNTNRGNQVVSPLGAEEIEYMEARLEMIRRLNKHLIEAKDEKEIISFTVDLIGDLTKAEGITFVPFDEYGLPLPAVIKGTMPEQELLAWAEHINSPETRSDCEACRTLHSSSGTTCPLQTQATIIAPEIYCLPIQREGDTLGMLNIYLPTMTPFTDKTRDFLEGVLYEMTIAAEAIRLRNQETALLRQLQLARSVKVSLSTSLSDLLDQIQNIMEPYFAVLVIRPADSGPIPQVFTRGCISSQLPPYVQDLLFKVFEDEQSIICENIEEESTFPSGKGSIIATPISLSASPAAGVLGIGIRFPFRFHSEHLLILQMVGVQIAQLIEQERKMVELEFQAVKKERTRLAREIHDGLAQTLAVLKLQTGQMQNYLARKDLAKLGQTLKLNHRTLASAYIDIRQSIDNLRLFPQESLYQWLEQIVDDFTRITDLEITLNLVESKTTSNLSAEIQAQLIRIIQETLSNIRKHAKATHVWISINEWNGDLIIEVRDDGQGFEPEDIPSISQYGLRGMRERSELIGADFQITSHLQQGTTVSLHVPIPFSETQI